MDLTADDRQLLEGEGGPAAQMAMRILHRMGEIQGARRFIPVESAHVDGCAYEGDAILDFVERLQALGGRVRVPTTLNAISVEYGNWRHLGLPETFGEKASRIVDAYLKMGIRPTFSCSPYQVGHRPAPGTHVAWAESNAIAFANSVLGARTDRYGDFLDISAALTGRVPEVGLHLYERRRGQIVFNLSDEVRRTLPVAFELYPLIGYLVGKASRHRIPVIEGVPASVPEDHLKALLAAAASSGSVALAHITGVTPEAPDLATALHGHPPEAETTITRTDLIRCREELSTQRTGAIDAVVLGSPHFSPAEFAAFAHLADGQKKADGVRVLITTSRQHRDLAQNEGSLEVALGFGAEVVVDTCILLAPLLAPGCRALMTNSGKYAHYAPGRLGVEVIFGSLADCVASAVSGKAVVGDSLWS